MWPNTIVLYGLVALAAGGALAGGVMVAKGISDIISPVDKNREVGEALAK